MIYKYPLNSRGSSNHSRKNSVSTRYNPNLTFRSWSFTFLAAIIYVIFPAKIWACSQCHGIEVSIQTVYI
jgi:hypothetical protein